MESRPDYKMIKTTADPIRLLKNIKAIMFQFQAECYAPLDHTTCQQYYESFKNNADVLEYARGMLGREPGLVDTELEAVGVKPDEATDAQLATAEAAAKECVLAIGLLIGSDHAHHRKLLEDCWRKLGNERRTDFC